MTPRAGAASIDPLAEQRAVNRYAFAIAKLRSRDARTDELAKVPEAYRDRVREVVTTMFINRRSV